MDASKTGTGLGLPLILAFCSSILGRNLKGGLVIVGGISIGGSIEPVFNAIDIAELAVEKGAQMLMIPVSARRQLNDLSDDVAAQLAVIYYLDVRDAVNKALAD
jgi:ATP-dependent Lon protease